MRFLDDFGYPGNRYKLNIIYRDFVEMSCDDMFFLNFLFQNCADGTSGFTRKCQNIEVPLPMRNIVWMKCKPNRDISILGNPWLIQFLPRKCLNMKGSMTSLFGGIPWIMFFWSGFFLVPGGPFWRFLGLPGEYRVPVSGRVRQFIF